MQIIILAGGKGTRLSEYTQEVPKPMVKIGTKPIIWHIIKYYYKYGFNDFIIALGHKGEVIKEYFYNYSKLNANLTINLKDGEVKYHNNSNLDLKVSLINTGLETSTGGRIKALEEFINKEEFMFTYGDGLSNINIPELISFHREKKKLLTMSAVHPPARFGELSIDDQSLLEDFEEKPQMQSGWINGGFFVANKKILKYINSPDEMFEREPIQRLAQEKEVAIYKHFGFWKCMDNRRDKEILTQIWEKGNAPWK